MKIANTFTVPRPRDKVWNLFQDVPRVATCIPGTQITEDLGEGKFKGRVEVKLGPITTAFEGDAQHAADTSSWSGTILGNGRDRGAGSRAKFSTVYRLAEVPGGTEVIVESDISLAGAVAQHAFEHQADRDRQPRQVAPHRLAQRRQRAQPARLVARDLERQAGGGERVAGGRDRGHAAGSWQ